VRDPATGRYAMDRRECRRPIALLAKELLEIEAAGTVFALRTGSRSMARCLRS